MNDHLNIHGLEKECQSAKANGILHGVTVAAGTRNALDVLWSWGHASVVPKRQAMRPDSVFDIASLTKVVATASACAICVDRKLLDPEAPACEYLPRLGKFQNSVIQVRDMASHCSGYDNRKFDTYAPHQLVTKAIETPAQWPAQEHFEYSCRNFIVLGNIVEQITGEGLATFCERNVFAPLGMSHTVFGPILSGLGHIVPTEQPVGTISDGQARRADSAVGNAGLFSNALDLAVFCQMILRRGKSGKGRIFGDKALGWLMRPCSPAKLPRRSFGWDMRACSECSQRPTALSQSAIGHSGWTGQSLWIDPGLGLYVIVLTNRTHAQKNGGVDTHASSEVFRARMADRLLSHLLQEGQNTGAACYRLIAET